MVGPKLREAMGAAAVAAAKAVDYVNAGTVEFLVDEDQNFYFLEMNTRLQVEHPVTEFVTGLDLVREQIRIAAGLPLSVQQSDIQLRGHAIEVRVCAEDAGRGFLPATGTVRSLEVPGGANVRFDSGLYSGQEIGVHYDPMLAKLIVGAQDRDSALRRMRRALQELKVAGVTNNIGFLLTLVEQKAVQEGNVHTKWIEENLDALLEQDNEEHRRLLAVMAAVLSREHSRRDAAKPVPVPMSNPWVMAGRRRALERWSS